MWFFIQISLNFPMSCDLVLQANEKNGFSNEAISFKTQKSNFR